MLKSVEIINVQMCHSEARNIICKNSSLCEKHHIHGSMNQSLLCQVSDYHITHLWVKIIDALIHVGFDTFWSFTKSVAV